MTSRAQPDPHRTTAARRLAVLDRRVVGEAARPYADIDRAPRLARALGESQMLRAWLAPPRAFAGIDQAGIAAGIALLQSIAPTDGRPLGWHLSHRGRRPDNPTPAAGIAAALLIRHAPGDHPNDQAAAALRLAYSPADPYGGRARAWAIRYGEALLSESFLESKT